MSGNFQSVIDNDLFSTPNRATDWTPFSLKRTSLLSLEKLFTPPAAYPNYLAAPEPLRNQLPCRAYVLSALLLLCLIPRYIVALRISGICPDGTLYIKLAQALNEGHLQKGFEVMSLNLYPVILMIMHRLGFAWETGGMVWGVLISSLVILPLYGFVRRQFDDRVACVACLMYAFHPIFILWSPELIRDSTFWFFFTLSLYFQWRAATEVRIGFWLAAGMTIVLATLTRFEGLFLLIPLCLWTFWRLRALASSGDKAKLAAGWVISLAVFPALLLLINLTWLRNHSQWEFFRLAPLARIQSCWNGMISASPAVSPDKIIEPEVGTTFRDMIRIYFPTLVKGLSPLFALLMLGGLWGWRRVWARRDHQALFYTALAIMSAIWIHTWYGKESCDRYFLSIALMSSCFAALGLLVLSKRIMGWVDSLKGMNYLRIFAAFAPLMLFASVGLGVVFSTPYESRKAEAELAAWIRHEFGPQAVMFGSEGVTPVVAYYARIDSISLTRFMDDPTVLASVETQKPDVVLVLATRRGNLSETRRLIDQIVKFGYCEMDRCRLPRGIDQSLLVLKRDNERAPLADDTGA
jgi:hypothetical protein